MANRFNQLTSIWNVLNKLLFYNGTPCDTVARHGQDDRHMRLNLTKPNYPRSRSSLGCGCPGATPLSRATVAFHPAEHYCCAIPGKVGGGGGGCRARRPRSIATPGGLPLFLPHCPSPSSLLLRARSLLLWLLVGVRPCTWAWRIQGPRSVRCSRLLRAGARGIISSLGFGCLSV